MYVYLSNSVRIAVKRGFTLEDSVNSTQITINIPGKYGLVNVQNGLNLYLNVRCIFCNFQKVDINISYYIITVCYLSFQQLKEIAQIYNYFNCLKGTVVYWTCTVKNEE